MADNYASVQRSISLATGDRVGAEDATQEAFARAHRLWARVSLMDRPVVWLYVVAVNQARRSMNQQQSASSPEAVAVEVAPDHAGRVVAGVSVRAALEALPPRQRLAVVLRYVADLSTAELAEAMGCAEGTVKSTLHAALSNLRVDLSEGDSCT